MPSVASLKRARVYAEPHPETEIGSEGEWRDLKMRATLLHAKPARAMRSLCKVEACVPDSAYGGCARRGRDVAKGASLVVRFGLCRLIGAVARGLKRASCAARVESRHDEASLFRSPSCFLVQRHFTLWTTCSATHGIDVR